jgi:hypothetical protein
VELIRAARMKMPISRRPRHDLRETLEWMERTYNPHQGGENFGLGHGTETHYLEKVQDRTFEITERFQRTLVLKGGCAIAVHHETTPVGVFRTVHSTGDYTLNLCDIDPTTIKLRKPDLHKDAFSCDDPEQVETFQLNCDTGEIDFRTKDDIQTISDDDVTTYEELTGKDHQAVGHTKQSETAFPVDDLKYAERFMNALRHAIDLCGGQKSKF